MTSRKIAGRGWKPKLRLPRNWFFTMLARWSPPVVDASTVGSPLVAERASAKLPSENGSTTRTARLQLETAEVNVEYLRHMYANTRGWYTASEMKAQLLLAVNGVFVTVLFGLLFGRPTDARAEVSQFGSGTLILIGVTAGALVGAIACATLCLWSLHGRAKAELTQLGVKRGESPSYQRKVSGTSGT